MRHVDTIHDREAGDAAGPSEAGSAPDPKENARAILRGCCGASSAFLRVNAVAKALGLSSTSIHSQIRQGRFPIPHRRVGHAVLVKFEDLVAWYCANERPPSPDAGAAARGPRANPPATAPAARERSDGEAIEGLPLFETSAERSNRIKKRVLAAMERQKRLDAASSGARADAGWETSKERAERIHREALAEKKRSKAGRRP